MRPSSFELRESCKVRPRERNLRKGPRHSRWIHREGRQITPNKWWEEHDALRAMKLAESAVGHIHVQRLGVPAATPPGVDHGAEDGVRLQATRVTNGGEQRRNDLTSTAAANVTLHVAVLRDE
eukprot:6198250-Pleurochrysis_carterae.AAC.4